MNYKKIVMSASTIAFVTALVIGGTGAFFSDTETSTANVFTAGSIDLKVDSTQHYNNAVCQDNIWVLTGPATVPQYPVAGSACDGTWLETDLGPQHQFFDFNDVKPGDSGENTISLHIINNDAYACADVSNIHNDDNTLVDPEVDLGDTLATGELAQNLDFLVWSDNGAGAHAGNNIWDADEAGDDTSGGAPLTDASFPLATPSTVAIAGGQTQYIGFAWCAGTFTAGGPGVTPVCDGSTMGNVAQTDSYKADITMRVEQARNNPNFSCDVPLVVTRPLVGAMAYVEPVSPACDVTVDDDFSSPTTGQANTIASGVALAADNQTVCVAPGAYHEFVVAKPLTILGLSDPEGGTPAVVTPTNAAVADLALVNSSNVTIKGLKFDGNGTVVAASQAAGVRISPIVASLSNVNIAYNVVTNISSAVGFAAKGIQWFTDTDSGLSLNNSTIEHNTISNISSNNKGGYGVQTVGSMTGVAIDNNTISNTTGNWGAGVAVDTKDTTLTAMSGNTIALNQIMTGVSDGLSRFSVQVENRIAATGVAINQNNLVTSLHGGGNGYLGTEGSLNAQSNWWGTATPVLAIDVFNSGANVTDFTLPEASAFIVN